MRPNIHWYNVGGGVGGGGVVGFGVGLVFHDCFKEFMISCATLFLSGSTLGSVVFWCVCTLGGGVGDGTGSRGVGAILGVKSGRGRVSARLSILAMLA